MIREGRALNPFQLQRDRKHNARGKHPGGAGQPRPGRDSSVVGQHSPVFSCGAGRLHTGYLLLMYRAMVMTFLFHESLRVPR